MYLRQTRFLAGLAFHVREFNPFTNQSVVFGYQPPPARLFFSRFESPLVYGLTSDKTATPTKALVVSFSGLNPSSLANSESILIPAWISRGPL